MNRVYIVTSDGRLFFGEKQSSAFELLECRHTNDFLKLKRMSSSPWSMWCLSSHFHLYLYTYLLDTPYEYQDVTYENQRRYNLLKANSFVDRLMITDRPKWSSMDGLLKLPKEDFKLPSDNWEWINDWSFELNSSEGWEYAVDFSAKFYQQSFTTAFVRRRKWTRSRRFKHCEEFIKIDTPHNDQVILDVSVGGWSLPYMDKGYLSVWIVTNTGNLYYRSKVSHANLEGCEWVTIDLPRGLRTFSCCCSEKGDLWVSTEQGGALVRTGINRQTPWGSSWLSVEQPPNGSGIKEISIGNAQTVWAIDNNGDIFYRSGICDNRPNGKEWVNIAGATVSSLSVSFNNQLWTVDRLDNALYFRYGIDDENPAGISWRKVHLKVKRSDDVEADSASVKSDQPYVLETSPESQISSVIEPNFELDPEPEQQPKLNDTKKPKEEITYITRSIYDSLPDDNCSTLTDESQNCTIAEAKIENNEPIEVNKYLPETRISKIAQINTDLDKQFDKLLQDLIIKEKEKKENQPKLENDQNEIQDNVSILSDQAFKYRSSSSFSSISTELMRLNHDQSYTSLSNLDLKYAFDDVNVTYCCANAFTLDSQTIPSAWFEPDHREAKFEPKVEMAEWRNDILLKLDKRNYSEIVNVDKITRGYLNDNWKKSEEFSYKLKNKKLVPSTLEILRYNTAEDKNTHHTQLIVMIKDKSNKIHSFEIDFSKIILVTRYVHPEHIYYNCFAIITNKSVMHTFFSLDEGKLTEWVGQLSLYCARLRPSKTLSNACTFVTSDGLAHYIYLNDENTPVFGQQIDGHFKTVEKHAKSGVTFGIGENGKLWLLDNQGNYKETYRGPYIQKDELEIQTYENQRWNAFSAVSGLSTGFTRLTLPTDRYSWSDKTGRISRKKEECTLPSSMFKWTTNWQVDFSLRPGVDKEGWQYAINFPNSFHAVRNRMKDFVRRRRWTRKCQIKTNGCWREIHQTHRIASLSLDQEPAASELLPDDKFLVWIADRDGYVYSSLVDIHSADSINWRHVSSQEKFSCISIGVGLKIWAIDIDGIVYFRNGVDHKSAYCGRNWTQVKFDEKIERDVRFRLVSVGDLAVWAVSVYGDLYVRDNVSKMLPEGTRWCLVDSKFKHVTVNRHNDVFAVTGDFHAQPNTVLYRNGIVKNNLLGSAWREVIPLKCKMFSNRGL